VHKLLACLLLLLPSISQAWWNDEWNFRKEITLDLTQAGGDIAATATDVPVLIRLSLGNFTYFGDVKPDGSDFRVIAGDDKTPLKFHVERFDAANQMAFIWVRVPQLTGGVNTDRIFLYYGNPNAPAAADAAGTYDANQALVLHLSETAGNPTDATAFGNAVATSNAELSAASLVGGGTVFSGANALTVPSSASLRLVPSKGLTMSAWLRIDAEQADAHVLSLADGAKSVVLGVAGTAPYARLSDGTTPVEVRGAPALVAGQWHHVAVSVGNARIALFVDGVEVGSSPTTVPEIAGTFTIGASATGGNFLTGAVDEVQVSSVVRPAEWIRAQARGQGTDSALVVYGNDAQREGEHVNYLATTLSNLTVDAWVVIGILAVMFVVSLMIMVSKALMLSRVKKANAAFLKEFERLRGDITSLDRPEDDNAEGDDALSASAFLPSLEGSDDRFRLSTVYRLYHHGVQELQSRQARSIVGASAVHALSPQAVEAIKATMDASMVRMTQKLQSKMVLLTIAISGGPFLGLLGTVVGVMITFAAIAASGDVNVNSIAPGIAAALAATVAGLAVAIPALFGYNWLNTQIREIMADMRVFVDEFVTRAAERYA
jgi:biopolymer transport protein ExbB